MFKFPVIKLKPLEIIKYAIAFAVVYNLIIIPLAAAMGLVLPPLLPNEALKIILLLGGTGV